MNNKTYDVLKYVALIALPASATLYGSISVVWGLPHTEEVVVTITAVNTFLGALLGLNSRTHRKAQLNTHNTHKAKENN